MRGPIEESSFSLTNVTHWYDQGEQRVSVLDAVDFEALSGQVSVIMGPSGSGKSTLLQILGLLENPRQGELRWNGQAVKALSPTEKAELRSNNAGFLFQDSGLIPHLSLLENVALPLMFKNVPVQERHNIARLALDRVGLGNRGETKVGKLSGGERQRGGLARAIVSSPKLLICDEPTAALDHQNAIQMINLISELAKDMKAVVVSTHDERLVDVADNLYLISAGKLRAKDDGRGS